MKNFIKNNSLTALGISVSHVEGGIKQREDTEKKWLFIFCVEL